MTRPVFALALSSLLLAGCNKANDASDAAEDKLERMADASAAAAGPAVAALGLSEAQLLDADLIGPNGIELGDVAQVVRGADGKVDRLLIEIEDSNPDRFVHLPITGLTVVKTGIDADLSTTMTAAQLAALPTVPLPKP